MQPAAEVRVAVASAALLGESPVWQPRERVLYYCDIAGHRLQRFDPRREELVQWDFDTDVASLAPRLDGSLLLAMRDGLWNFDPRSGARTRLCEPPYDPQRERFNDGKCDPQGRFWVGTSYEPRKPPLATLHCWAQGQLLLRGDAMTVVNGLAWSPNGRTMYWSDTTAHTIYVADFDRTSGAVSARRVFTSFARKQPGAPLEAYGGRPDGAAVDAEGCYWIAMFEGQRVLRLSPGGDVLRDVALPVRCPTMPCFGGDDLKTLYITTAREHRPAAELAEQPLAGCVLALEVDVPGLPVNFAV